MKQGSTHVSSARIHEYIDNTLSSEEKANAGDHLRDCGECKRAFEAFTGIDSSLKDLPLERTSPGFTRTVMERVNVARHSPFAFRVLENVAYLFGFFIVATITVTAFIVTGVLDAGQVSETQSAVGEVFSKAGSGMASSVEGLSKWLASFLPFAFAKGSLSVSLVALSVVIILAITDRLFLRRFMHKVH